MTSEKTEIVRRRRGELAKVAANWALPAFGIGLLVIKLAVLVLR